MAIKTDFVAGSSGNATDMNKNWSALDKIVMGNEVPNGLQITGNYHNRSEGDTKILGTGDVSRVVGSLDVVGGIYNRNVGLRNFLRKPNPSIHVMGDSISEDPNGYVTMGGGDRWPDYIANQLALRVGRKDYRGVNFRAGGENFDSWNRLDYGINRMTWKSNPSSQPLRLYFDNPIYIPLDIKLLVSSAPDGGSFKVRLEDKLSGTVLVTGTSAGVLGDITEVSFSVNSDKNIYICPDSTSSPVYVYGWYGRRTGITKKDSGCVYNSSLGGRRLTDFSDSDIAKTIDAYDADLFVMALGANDITGLVSWDDFLAKLNKVKDSCVSSGIEILILIHSRADVGDTTTAYINQYNTYIQNLIDYGISNNYCVINMDEVLGGYTKANADGLLLDTVHPNALGHKSIGMFVSNTLFGAYQTGATPDREGTSNGVVIDNESAIMSNKLASVGGIQYSAATPSWEEKTYNIQSGGACLKSELPFLGGQLWVGYQMYITDESKLYICTSVTPVTWKTIAVV